MKEDERDKPNQSASQRPIQNHPDSVHSAETAVDPDIAESKDYEVAAANIEHEHIGPNYHKVESKRNLKKPLVFIVIILVASAIIIGIYFAFFKPRQATAPTPQKQQTQSSASNAPAIETKHYDSENFNLGFDYPSDWKVSDSSGSGKLTVTSPSVKLKNASGQQVDGQITMTIRDKSQKLTEFDKGNAAAVRDSEKINYTKPTQAQRASTYISFLSYAGSDVSGGLDGIYITSDNGYQTDQAIPAVDISKVDPVINVTFTKSAAPLTVALSSWKDPVFSKPIKTLLQSLAIQ